MSKIVVVYHSGYGHTKVIAESIARGANAQLVAINENGDITDQEWTRLNEADAIIMGTPTYMGNVSWQFKKFADASSKNYFERKWQDKIFGGFTISASPSGDKQVALITLQTLASQHGGIWVSLGLLPASTKASTTDDPNNLGGFGGVLARAPADATVDEVHKGDIITGELYGKRIATITNKMKNH